MFDLGWGELLIIGVIALIVVGPKDLPGMFRTLGRFTGKMRGLAREFQRAMDRAADETGMADVAKDLRKTTSSKSLGLNVVNEMTDRVTNTLKATGAEKQSSWTHAKATGASASFSSPEPATDSKPAAEDPAVDASQEEESKQSAHAEHSQASETHSDGDARATDSS